MMRSGLKSSSTKPMPKRTPIPREQWIPEIPFDVAEWGDKPDPHPEGLFKTKKEYDEAVAEAQRRFGDPPLE